MNVNRPLRHGALSWKRRYVVVRYQELTLLVGSLAPQWVCLPQGTPLATTDLFDLDCTLFDFDPSEMAAFQITLAEGPGRRPGAHPIGSENDPRSRAGTLNPIQVRTKHVEQLVEQFGINCGIDTCWYSSSRIPEPSVTTKYRVRTLVEIPAIERGD